MYQGMILEQSWSNLCTIGVSRGATSAMISVVVRLNAVMTL